MGDAAAQRVVSATTMAHAAVPAAAILLTLALGACDQRNELREPSRERARRDEVEIAEAASAASVAELADDPAVWAGRSVVLEGEVERPDGPRLFLLGENGLGEDKVLVVLDAAAGTGDSLPWPEDAEVRVTGTVRPITPAEIERRTGVRVDSAFAAEIGAMAVVVATRVEEVREEGSSER